jgi:hypothetical protein
MTSPLSSQHEDRMLRSPFRDKRKSEAAYKGTQQFQLRCLKDGSLRTFTNDGPFPVDADGKPVAGWQNMARHTHAAECLRKFRQREPDPRDPDNDEKIVPLFVFDGDGPLPKVWDNRTLTYAEPIRMTEDLKDVMRVFCEQRNQVENMVKAQIAAKKSQEQGVLERLAEVLKQPAPQAPSKPAAKAGGAA